MLEFHGLIERPREFDHFGFVMGEVGVVLQVGVVERLGPPDSQDVNHESFDPRCVLPPSLVNGKTFGGVLADVLVLAHGAVRRVVS